MASTEEFDDHMKTVTSKSGVAIVLSKPGGLIYQFIKWN